MKTIVANSERGLTLIDVVVVIAVLALLIMGGILPLMGSNRGKQRAQRINCVNNLRQIGPALKLWASFHDDKYMMDVSVTNGGTMELLPNGLAYMQFRVISNELFGPKILHCPADYNRALARSFQGGDFGNTNLSYFLNIDMIVANTYPFFVGDRNLSLSNAPVKPGLVSISVNSPLGWATEMHNGQGNNPYPFFVGDRNLSLSNAPVKPWLVSVSVNSPLGWTTEMHGGQGNMMRADGSVEQLDNANLHHELEFPGMSPNRWVVP